MSDLSKEKLIEIHYFMTLSRLLDECLIQIYKKGQGYFWVGAPGEEALGVPLGLLVQKGRGLNFDWLYLHYRCTGTVVSMGLDTKNAIRQMMSRKTDPFTGGRNFVHHYCIPEWNIPPVTSVVEMQHSIAIGTAYAQFSTDAITIVTGGDAGTAMPDFATSLIWSSRPHCFLPLLIIVLNNQWGISTHYSSQHGGKSISERAQAFGIQTYRVDGNDPIKSYLILKKSMDYVRKKRKPALVEAQVSRLYGHSSSSGAVYVDSEKCCLKNFESYLVKKKILKQAQITNIRNRILKKLKQESAEVILEEEPSDIWSYVYANKESADWRQF